MLDFSVCVCGGGGYFYVVVFNAIFFEFRANMSFSCQTDIICWKNIFIDNILTRIFSYNILKGNMCTSRRTQL